MFGMNFTGSNADAVTALASLATQGDSAVETEMAAVTAEAIEIAIVDNDLVDVGTQYLGNLRIKVQGSWKPNSFRLTIEIDPVELHEGKILSIPCAPPDITTTV